MSAGAITGGTLGAVAGAGASVIPGVAPAILAGAGIGAIAGGLGGTLTDIGLPDNQVEFLNQKLGHGHALVFVRAADELLPVAQSIFAERGALDVASQSDLTESPTKDEQIKASESDRRQPLPPLP